MHRLAAKWGVTWGVVLSSIFFGLAHLNIHSLSIGVSSIVTALIYLKTQMLIVPIIFHALNNLIFLISRDEVEKKIDALLVRIAGDTVEQSVVCPYLDENSGSCLIYDARPIACRTYGFFVERKSNLYCKLIEAEVSVRNDNVVWGNAEAINDEVARLDGEKITFEVHYTESKI